MKAWTRRAPLGSAQQTRRQEIWEFSDNSQSPVAFEVEVMIGKPLDVLALKSTSLDDVRDYANFLQQTADRLYATQQDYRQISQCPCCDTETAQAPIDLSVFGIAYHRCQQCGHVFVGRQPTQEILNEIFTESSEHSAVYTDKDSLEIRLSQIIKPKVDWVTEIYRRQYGKELTSAVDVGAGGGHFIEGLKRAGIYAEGYELSLASRHFAKQIFDIDLRNDDFLEAEVKQGKFDVITFWGLLEYTPEPKKFLQTAHQWLAQESGLLVIEVPRFDCVSTAIQREYPATIARHLDPTSHVNCFSDASLATALFTSGFRPVAAWYFGLDAYELIVQLALQRNDTGVLEQFAPSIPGLQAAFDSAQLCDDIIVAAVPLK